MLLPGTLILSLLLLLLEPSFLEAHVAEELVGLLALEKKATAALAVVRALI